ncbi:MAG TPA: uroporphyrinogen-III synthase [Bryobacteraceae bacterium]|jgi:uroporphyrinogen-III synthase|nr:uroporphyrinogen-III synthase [Bryobacteraceae bacterium]
MRYLAFESRRAKEIAELIRRQGGDVLVAPAMREVPLEHNAEVFEFAERLFSGSFDMVVFLTGVGVRALNAALRERYGPQAFPDALRKVVVAARGPKPVAALRELNVPAALQAPEPNTWRELLAVTEGRPERRIAVQEYGRSNPELLSALRARGAEVTPVRVYRWDLPEDLGPLREASRRLAAHEFDIVLFTSGAQIDHLFRIARDLGIEEAVRSGLRSAVLGSIGPTTTEALEEYGLRPSLEPSHPKMGFLVREAAEFAAKVR